MLFDVLSLTDASLCCAIFATIIFIVRTCIPIDFGTEVSGDFTDFADSDASFNLFSFESICAFFMCSGWIGWLCLKHLHYSAKLSGGIAVTVGIMGMFLFAWLIAQIKKLEHAPKANLEELINKTGTAYMNFAPKGASKIQIEFNSKLATMDAINDSDEEIKSFEKIKVTKIENQQIYIVKGE